MATAKDRVFANEGPGFLTIAERAARAVVSDAVLEEIAAFYARQKSSEPPQHIAITVAVEAL